MLVNQPHQHSTPKLCRMCGDEIDPPERARLVPLCLWCGEDAARTERLSWTVLTPHKQGPMFFTAAFAKEAAIGINNKGGLVK